MTSVAQTIASGVNSNPLQSNPESYQVTNGLRMMGRFAVHIVTVFVDSIKTIVLAAALALTTLARLATFQGFECIERAYTKIQGHLKPTKQPIKGACVGAEVSAIPRSATVDTNAAGTKHVSKGLGFTAINVGRVTFFSQKMLIFSVAVTSLGVLMETFLVGAASLGVFMLGKDLVLLRDLFESGLCQVFPDDWTPSFVF